LERIPDAELEAIGVTGKRIRKQLFSPKIAGVPEDLSMYRLRTRRDLTASGGEDGDAPSG
jgi:adenylate cyclase